MVLVVREAAAILYEWLVEYSDPRTDDWWLVGSPLPIAVLTLLYVWGSVHVGPALMRHRQPFDLKAVIVCYNVFQVLANGALFVFGVYWSYAQPDFDLLCELLTPSSDRSHAAYQVLYGAYGYLLLKLADYCDTLFFVLRKQRSHISFLHVYHHALMGLVGFVGVRYAPGGNGAILVLANTFVHTVMYTYYLLSALERTRELAARCKKHITQLQLVQFVCIGSHYTQAYLTESCRFPDILCIGLMLQNIFMSAMFLDFYVRTYWRKPAAEAKAKAAAAAAAINGNGTGKGNGNGNGNGTTTTVTTSNGHSNGSKSMKKTSVNGAARTTAANGAVKSEKAGSL